MDTGDNPRLGTHLAHTARTESQPSHLHLIESLQQICVRTYDPSQVIANKGTVINQDDFHLEMMEQIPLYEVRSTESQRDGSSSNKTMSGIGSSHKRKRTQDEEHVVPLQEPHPVKEESVSGSGLVESEDFEPRQSKTITLKVHFEGPKSTPKESEHMHENLMMKSRDLEPLSKGTKPSRPNNTRSVLEPSELLPGRDFKIDVSFLATWDSRDSKGFTDDENRFFDTVRRLLSKTPQSYGAGDNEIKDRFGSSRWAVKTAFLTLFKDTDTTKLGPYSRFIIQLSKSFPVAMEQLFGVAESPVSSAAQAINTIRLKDIDVAGFCFAFVMSLGVANIFGRRFVEKSSARREQREQCLKNWISSGDLLMADISRIILLEPDERDYERAGDRKYRAEEPIGRFVERFSEEARPILEQWSHRNFGDETWEHLLGELRKAMCDLADLRKRMLLGEEEYQVILPQTFAGFDPETMYTQQLARGSDDFETRGQVCIALSPIVKARRPIKGKPIEMGPWRIVSKAQVIVC